MNTEILLLHLNTGQVHIVNTSSVIALVEKLDLNTLANKSIRWNDQTEVQLPFFPPTKNTSISYQVRSSLLIDEDLQTMFQGILLPLAPVSDASVVTTNLSRSLSLTFLNENGEEIDLPSQSIELFIPRDPNLILPPFILQNVSFISSSINQSSNNRQFNLHQISLKLSASLHLEISPLDRNRSYLLIYRFDAIPQLNSSINRTDGSIVFFPQGKRSLEDSSLIGMFRFE